MEQKTKKKEVEFRLIDDDELPPIVITIGENDMPKVVINRRYCIWLSLHRKTIGGCSEALFDKLLELLQDHLTEQRMFERME